MVAVYIQFGYECHIRVARSMELVGFLNNKIISVIYHQMRCKCCKTTIYNQRGRILRVRIPLVNSDLNFDLTCCFSKVLSFISMTDTHEDHSQKSVCSRSHLLNRGPSRNVGLLVTNSLIVFGLLRVSLITLVIYVADL